MKIHLMLSASVVAFAPVMQPAVAQTAPDSPTPTQSAGQEAPATANEDIVVTGSRLSNAFNAPTPVTSVSQETLLAAAPSTLAEGLKQLPSIIPGGGPTAGGGTASGGQNFLNMRGLGFLRTLVLVDGRRFAPSGPANLVDVNLIPQALVQRVDVVTGGASATYGSDAVAGVVNFVLDRRFTGLKAEVTSGISQQGDNHEFRAALTYGTSALDGRLRFVISGEYFDNDGVNGDARDFRVKAGQQIANPANPAMLVHADDFRTPYTLGGLITGVTGGAAGSAALLRGTQFGPGGVTMPYSFGTLTTANAQNGGDGFRVSTGQEIVRPLSRKTVFSHLDFDIAGNVTLFLEGSYSKTRSLFQNSPTLNTFSVGRGNPYLAQVAPQIVAQMTASGVTALTINRLILENGLTRTDNENETIRALGGLEGKLGGWTWSASYQYGRNRNTAPVYNNLITANLTRAVNAVSSGGQIVCADTLSADPARRAAAAGCVPFNPFGIGAPSQGALDYIFGTSQNDNVTEQQVADFNLSGDLFNLPAGAVSVAVGGEWREIKSRTTSDLLSQQFAYRLVNAQPFYGKYNVKEVFGEIQVPVLKDSAVAKSLDINLAGRYTDYSTSGGVETWKAGINWQVIDGLRLRATRSRDIRAPNLEELFATGRQQNVLINDSLTGVTYPQVPSPTFGNPDLKPEKADTLVIGAVLQPGFLPGFSLAIDYFDIKVKDAISNIRADAIVRECNLSNQTSSLCDFVTRDPATRALTRVVSTNYNLASQDTSGVDFEAAYRLTVAGNPLTLRAVGSYTDKNTVRSPLIAVPINDVGNLNPQAIAYAMPRWRVTGSVNYDAAKFGLFLQGRYISPMMYDKTRTLGATTDFQNVAAQFYLDGQVSVKTPFLGGQSEFFLNVQNILDHDPPYSPRTIASLPVNADLYDQIGRMYRIGIKAKF